MKLRILRSPTGETGLFELSEKQETILGRESDCTIRLLDPESSRHHVRIFFKDGYFRIQDLGSKNGTRLNGQPIQQAVLEAGDQLLVGSTVIGVLDDAPAETDVPAAEDSKVLMTLRQQEADVLSGTLSRTASLEALRRENLLLREVSRITQILTEGRPSDALLKTILDDLLSLLSADTACVLVWPDLSKPWTIRAIASFTDTPGTVRISRTIVREALRKGVAILSRDTADDERFEASQSILGEGVSTAICTPFKVGGSFGGVLFLDRRRRHDAFMEMDLRLAASVSGIIGLLLEKVHYEEEARRRQRLAVIGEVVAGLAHYIKNVVTGFRVTISALEAALKNNRPEYAERCLAAITDQERRISNLMMNMLSYSRDREPQKTECSAEALIREVVAPYREWLDEKGIRFEFDAPDADPKIYGEELALHRVFLNLFLNAVDALESREEDAAKRLTIRVEGGPDAPETVVRVRDTGCGIPPDKLDAIFETFYSTKGSGGTGLGLAVVRKILREHGGDITVTSTLGRGTEFTVRLPARPAPETDPTPPDS